MIGWKARRLSRKLALEALEQRKLLVGSVFANADVSVLEGEQVTLSGIYFAAEGDGEVSWLWEAKSSTGETVATGDAADFIFTPNDDGRYDLTVTVTDDAGESTSDSVVVTAKNVPPKLTITGPSTVAANVPYQVNLSSFDPGDDTLESWTIDWGDGSEPETFPGSATGASHIYSTGSARYSIVATAADEDANYAVSNLGDWEVTKLDETFGTNGEVLTSFSARVRAQAENIHVLDSGKILVQGRKFEGVEPVVFARYNADGTPDLAFGNQGIAAPSIPGFVGHSFPYKFAVDAESRILVVGSFGVARLKESGELDTSFGAQGVANSFAYPSNIILDSQGRILLSHGYSVTRLLPNGQIDANFNQGVSLDLRSRIAALNVNLFDFAVDDQDRILLAGHAVAGSKASTIIIRVNNVGAFDDSFGVNGYVKFDLDNKWNSGRYIAGTGGTILVGGVVSDGSTDTLLIRLLDDGSLDSSYGGGSGIARINFNVSNSFATGFHLAPNGEILTTGEFGWARISSTGELDAIYRDQTVAVRKAIALDHNGNVLIAGARYDAGLAFSMARYSSTGVLDTTYGNWDEDGIAGAITMAMYGAARDVANAVSVNLPNGGVLTAGSRSEAGGTLPIVAKYTTGGVLDTSFGDQGKLVIPTQYFSRVTKLTVDSIGRILVLVQDDSLLEVGVLRYFSDGTPDNSFGAGADNWSRLPAMTGLAMQITATGDIVIVGEAGVNLLSELQISIVKLKGDTGLPSTGFGNAGTVLATLNMFAPAPTGMAAGVTLSDMAIDHLGRIIIAGQRYFLDGVNFSLAGYIVRYTSQGALDTTFGVGSSFMVDGRVLEQSPGIVAFDSDNHSLSALAIDSQNNIYTVGGYAVNKLTSAGVRDTAFGQQGRAVLPWELIDVAIDSQDRPVIGGYGLGRLLKDGSLDHSFAPGGYLPLDRRHITALAIDSQQRIVIAGDTIGPDGSFDFYTARIVPASAELFVDVLPSTLTLLSPLIQAGLNTFTITHGTVGSALYLAIGSQPGLEEISEYGITLNVLEPTIVSVGVVSADGRAEFPIELSAEQLSDITFLQAFEVGVTSRASNVISIGSPLRTAEGVGSVTATANVSPALRAEALARWQASGISAAQLARLRSVTISMLDLPGDILGQTVGTKIYLDPTAAGQGWFVDPTPQSHQEFQTITNIIERTATSSDARGRVDMLTVLMHEMGHVLGLNDVESHGNHALMAHTLPTSLRRMPPNSYPLDASRDGFYSPLDALLIINHMNAVGAGAGVTANEVALDVNADGFITPLDAAMIIAFLNSPDATVQAEPPHEVRSTTSPGTLAYHSNEASSEPSKMHELSHAYWFYQSTDSHSRKHKVESIFAEIGAK